jgi:DNA-binding transcriptional LysR family regulator
MWRDLELRELRIFLTLADELHFGRTAERLGISQPGVSEAVRILESRLGIKVFDRTSRRVRLTPAGEALRSSLVPALAALDQALAQTSELSRSVRGLLRVGFVLTTEGPALSRLVAAFQARYPACEVRLTEVETFDAYRPLRRDDIDVLCNWLAVDEPDLTAGTAFARYQRALVVAPAHRLAGQPAVSVEELAGEEVALLPPSTPAAVYDLLIPPRTPSGRPIRRTQPAQTVNEVLSLVARGLIVHPTSSTIPIFNRDDVVLVPISDLPPLPLGLVWCTSREDPRIRALNDIASSMAAGAPPLGGAHNHARLTTRLTMRVNFRASADRRGHLGQTQQCRTSDARAFPQRHRRPASSQQTGLSPRCRGHRPAVTNPSLNEFCSNCFASSRRSVGLDVMGERDKVAGYAFISYVREDASRVDQIQRRLEAAGIRVWRDTRELWPGEDWGKR